MHASLAGGRRAGGGRASRSRDRDQGHSLDVASLPGHGNEDYQKAHARALTQARALVRYAAPPTHNYHTHGVVIIQSCCSTCNGCSEAY